MKARSIVWIGPMSADECSRRAIDLRQFLVTPLCEKHCIDLRVPERDKAENWFEELLRAIRESDGVICDMSGAKPNVCLELGYALALNIPVLLLSQTGSVIPSDLATIQRVEYSAIADAEQRVGEWLDRIPSWAADVDLPTITERTAHEWRVLEGNGVVEYHHRGDSDEPFQFSVTALPPLTLKAVSQQDPEFGAALEQIHGIQRDIAERTARPFFNGQLMGYVTHVPRRNDSGTEVGATIRYRDTDYFSFVATHYPSAAIEKARDLKLRGDEPLSALSARVDALKRSGRWILAKPLTATYYVLAQQGERETLVLQKRNVSKNFHALYPWQATGAGMVHPSAIRDGIGRMRVDIAGRHEIREELGDVDQFNITTLALVEEKTNGECGFVGYAVIPVHQVNKRGPAMDGFETEHFKPVPFTPSAIRRFIVDVARGGADFVPLALAALGMLVIHKFGRTEFTKILWC